MLPEFTRTLAHNSADGFLKFAEEIRDLARIYDQNLTKITEITLWVGHCPRKIIDNLSQSVKSSTTLALSLIFKDR